MTLPAYAHYTERMYILGHGLALYEPDSQRNQLNTRFPVQIGDVGRVHLGMFCRLFNILHDQDHPINARGVPVDFSPLPSNFHAIMERGLHSLVIQVHNSREVGGQLSGNG